MKYYSYSAGLVDQIPPPKNGEQVYIRYTKAERTEHDATGSHDLGMANGLPIMYGPLLPDPNDAVLEISTKPRRFVP